MKATQAADFASRLFEVLARAKKGENLFLSPFSIHTALAMCAAGAGGATRKILADLLGLPEEEGKRQRLLADRIAAVNAAAGPDLQLSTANALWAQRGLPLRPEYLKTVADHYRGALDEVDFGDTAQAARTIDAWVEKATAGKIRHLLSGQVLSPDSRLILTNAVHFKGLWQYAFDKDQTMDEDWYGPGGVRQIPMMQVRATVPYAENEAYQAVELPYRGGAWAMLVILPRQDDELPALEAQAAAIFEDLPRTALLQQGEVIVSLPRFRIEAHCDLQPVLRAMGAALPFEPGADFSGISHEPLRLGEVLHKAFVEVDEEGTTAAAATAVGMVKCAVESLPVIRADHPFLFAIRERNTGTILFCGRLLEPQSSSIV